MTKYDNSITISSEKSHTAQQQAIMILGMHRSGTSAVARMLSLLGGKLPIHLSGPGRGNETGHWEPSRIVALNDEILKEAGSHWSDPLSLGPDRLPTSRREAYINELADILREEYQGQSMIVIKDPRACRLSDFFKAALKKAGYTPNYVLPYRNPLSVIESLTERDGMSTRHAALLWLRHVVDAERATRNHPRCFVSYEQLLNNWREQAAKISIALELNWPDESDTSSRAIDQFISKSLQHHNHSPESIRGSGVLSEPLEHAYSLLLQLDLEPEDREARNSLDKIKKDLDTVCTYFGRGIAENWNTNSLAPAQHPEDERNHDDGETGDSETLLNEQRLEHLIQKIDDQQSNLNLIALKSQGMHDELALRISSMNKILDRIITQSAEENERRINSEDRLLNFLNRQSKSMGEAIEHLTHELEKSRKNQCGLCEIREQKEEDLKEKLKHTEATYQKAENEAREEIDILKQKLSATENEREQLLNAYQAALLDYQKEKLSVLRPLYRNIYRRMGQTLRALLPERAVSKLRQIAPNPEGIPTRLGNPELPAATDTGCTSLVDPAVKASDVFILSIIDWDFRHQRPQHIARGLSENHRVFYIEMLLSPEGLTVRKLENNLYCIRLPMGDIGHIPAYTGQPDNETVQKWINEFYRFCDAVNSTQFKNIVIHHPFWWQFARLLPPEFHITFDCMDDISGFSNTEPFLLELEREMISQRDQLVASSQYLYDKYATGKTPTLIRNAGETTHFDPENTTAQTPKFLDKRGFLKRQGIINVGYVGAIAEWFDSELLAEVANKSPDMQFHLCGAITCAQASNLGEHANITLYGEIPYQDVPAFIQAMDVMIIPFKLLPIIHACDPVKFYEYSAMEKPTVSTPLPELRRVESLLTLAQNAEDFSRGIRDAVQKSDDEQFRKSLSDYAAENTWLHRTSDFDAVLSNLPKVSVVILSYGPSSWAEATIHSLFSYGENYPNLEVIVVDNGSPSEDVERIRETLKDYPSSKLIENGQNLGFAAGNNVGIRAATGEYMLLLNNDTYIAPGSIHGMVRHLLKNPGIGAVGPLTNNIGNEAKIDINYADMASMKHAARQLTTGYRGLFTPISVLAYFSVMFRTRDIELFGLLSEDYGRGMFEDDDHCANIRSKGYICALAEDCFVHHHLSATFNTSMPSEEKKALFEKNKAIYESRWGQWKPHTYREQRPLSRMNQQR